MQILINKITGAMIPYINGSNLGIEGNKLLINPNISSKVISGELEEHFRLRHCRYINGTVVVLPEEEWPENIPQEKPIEEEII